MARFFVLPEQVDENNKIVHIIGSDVKHIRDVLRLTSGEEITVCDSTASEYICVLSKIGKDFVDADIIETKISDNEPQVEVVLYQGIPKGEKMELIIQKNVELGINKIVPVIMERTIVKFDTKKDAEKKAERWNKIAAEASKQCARNVIPTVDLPILFKEAITQIAQNSLKIIPYENEKEMRLKGLLQKFVEERINNRTIAVIIGPEGGISNNEMEFAINNGFKPITLGKRILRTETAGFAVLSAIRYELED